MSFQDFDTNPAGSIDSHGMQCSLSKSPLFISSEKGDNCNNIVFRIKNCE